MTVQRIGVISKIMNHIGQVMFILKSLVDKHDSGQVPSTSH